MPVHCQILFHDSVYPGMVTASLWLVYGDRENPPTSPYTRPSLHEGQLPSSSVDFDFVGEIGHLSRVPFFVCWVSPSGSDGRKKLVQNPHFSPWV